MYVGVGYYKRKQIVASHLSDYKMYSASLSL